MKKLRWQILIVILTLVVVAVLLLTQKGSEATITLPEPASGGIYTEALVGSFSRLNPMLDLNNRVDREVDHLIFSGLLRFDSYGTPFADLAESWGVSADGTIYNVSIRTNAYWHDGRPVTSDDVLFTIGLLRSGYSSFPADVQNLWIEIEVVRLDDKTLQFRLPEPFSPFLDYLTFGILPLHLLQNVPPDQLANAPFNLLPVGTGPYRFQELLVEQGQVTGVILAANTSYYGPVPYIEQIVFRYYPDSAAALEAYRAGEVLAIGQIATDVVADALAEPGLNLYSSRLPRLTLVLLNLNNNEVAFFQEKNVRLALLMSVNRQWMVNQYLHGQAIIADSPILPGTWAYYDGIDLMSFDPDGAVELLKDEGYVIPANGTVREKDGVPLSFNMLVPDDELHAQLAGVIQENWAAIGVEVNLQVVSYGSLLNDSLALRNYEAALVDLDMSRSYDPDPYPFWHQSAATGGQNYSQWDNRTASEYLEQARVIADRDVRARLYRNFQVIFAREMPALPLFYPVYNYGVDAAVNGVQVAPLFEPGDRFNTIYEWYLVTQRAVDEGEQP
ncbi:MAG: peptide ABC transporter substrate-binding protein [Anaerolineales bacterium]|nr:peptide ABC transporter substrate-binding protein [Anaerolineales bacterium]